VSARYDAIVIGGGVAGASTAILLAQRGWSVVLVEKRAFPRRKVCGECVAAPNLELLDALGVGEALAALAGPQLERLALYEGDHVLAAQLPRLRGGSAPWGRALGREHLDVLLLARAALGVEVRQTWNASDVERRDGLHVCTIVAGGAAQSPRAAATLVAPVVIDAHGSWERAPAAAERVQVSARASDLFAFKANFADTQLPLGELPVLAFAGGYGGMVIAGDRKLTLACCVRRDRLREWRTRLPNVAAGEAVEALLRDSCAGVRAALHGAQRVEPWLSVGPLRPGMRAPWTEQRGFAVGNAAGEAHPILGEGISMALQGAWLLSARLEEQRNALLAGGSQAPAARAYARDWRRNFAGRVRWAALLAQLAMRPGAARALQPVLRRWPGLLTVGAIIGGKVRRPCGGAASPAERAPLEVAMPTAAAGAHAKVRIESEVPGSIA
jgi:flavin-dependent dehydrogenase